MFRPQPQRRRAHRLGRKLRRRILRPGEKRGECVGKTKRGKGTKWMVVADGEGLPLGARLASASPAEVTLIEETLDAIPLKWPRPKRVIYDRAADSDALRERLRRRGIELICPHRKKRRKPPTQDGRPLRRYKRRWKIERTMAWIGNFKRLLLRFERRIEIYKAFFALACIMILIRRF